MPRPNPHLVRAGLVIASALSASASPRRIPWAEWDEVADADRRRAKALDRGWGLAAARMEIGIQAASIRLQRRLEEIRYSQTELCVASPGEIVLDLISLQDEFEEVKTDLRGKRISVTTSPIELEGIMLGGFEIALTWSQIGKCEQPYSVSALDPNPSRSGDSMHPHLVGQSLCEGEGRQAIRAALQSGRLLDFFLLVRQILTTYNASSAYCELERWDGVTCVDCGDWADETERCLCDRCGDDLCGSCSVECSQCSQWSCSECRVTCAKCDRSFCTPCLESEADDRNWCEECQSTETKGGTDAHASATKTPAATAMETGPASDAHRLGQTLLLA